MYVQVCTVVHKPDEEIPQLLGMKAGKVLGDNESSSFETGISTSSLPLRLRLRP